MRNAESFAVFFVLNCGVVERIQLTVVAEQHTLSKLSKLVQFNQSIEHRALILTGSDHKKPHGIPFRKFD